VWRARFVIENGGERYGVDNVNSQPSREEAEQNALGLGLQAAKGTIPMPDMPFKPRLNEDDYIAELNRRLPEHPYYEPWMRFHAHPDGAVGAGVLGVAMAGDALQQQHRAYTSTAKAVEAKYDLFATQRPLSK
jgi:hypothetical protein